MLKEMKIDEFVEKLSSKSPVPGGGSVAGLIAALSGALASMVFNLTIGKKVYNNYDPEIKNKILNSVELVNRKRKEFIDFMESDGEVFSMVMDAYKLPKDNEKQKIDRDVMIEKAYKKALEVPYNLAVSSFELYDCIDISAEYGSNHAISDAGVAAILIQSSIESAILNVKINLSYLPKLHERDDIMLKCRDMVEEGKIRRDKILEIVNSKI